MSCNIIQELPILYGVDKNDRIKSWYAKINIIDNDQNNIESVIEHGLVDGKKIISKRSYTTGKNIGKKNETTPLQQCIAETKKKWNDKIEKESYYIKPSTNELVSIDDKKIITKKDTHTESEKDTHTESEKIILTTEENQNSQTTLLVPPKKIFPMLAQTFDPNNKKNKKNNIVFPCYVQPKLDGLRCITYLSCDEKSVITQSRTGSLFTSMNTIRNELLPLFLEYKHIAIDGELYTKDIPFETLAGIIKKEKITPKDTKILEKINYYIYDIIDLKNNSMIFENRFKFIDQNIRVNLSINNSTHINILKTDYVFDISQFKLKFNEFVNDGYEGIMLRNEKGIYRESYRSYDLQKYKEFFEDEYEIIGFKEGEGRDKGTVIWICKTPDTYGSREFSVRPRGTIEARTELYNNGANYIGKKLTVIYQELSEMNVPRFPVGKDIRDGY